MLSSECLEKLNQLCMYYLEVRSMVFLIGMAATRFANDQRAS
jgi:hypothetical protein